MAKPHINSSGEGTPSQERSPSNNLDILIAEDSATQAVLLEYTLSKRGYTILVTGNGRDALEAVVRHRPKLVISDIVMPVMDGFELCSAIKNAPETHTTRVILLTALSDPEDITHALAAQADCFLTKPFQEDYLLSLVQRMLESRTEDSTGDAQAENVEVHFAGQKHVITAQRQQILSLLLSTFESAMQKNTELLRAQCELQKLNSELEQRVRQRTNALTQEIIERQRVEQEKTNLADSLELILSSAAEGICELDREGRFTFVNDAVLHILGYERHEMIGQNAHTLVHHSHSDGSAYPDDSCPISNCIRSAQSRTSVLDVFWRRDGTSCSVEYSANPLKENGRTKGVVVTFNDITGRLKDEEKLRSRMQRLQALRSIDVAILQRDNRESLLNVVAKLACSELNADAACMLLADKNLTELYVGGSRGFKTPKSDYKIPLKTSLAGSVALSRKNVCLRIVPDELRSSIFSLDQLVGYFATPMVVQDDVVGVMEVFTRTPLEPDDEWIEFAETLAGQMAIALDQNKLFEDLRQSNEELRTAYETTLEGWSRALDLRDKETEGHTQRVSEATIRLAKAMGISDEEIVHMRRGALLHDIGKMGIPDSILLKPGKLTDEEWTIMKKHPSYAYELLLPIPYLRPALDVPYCHHEKWDGTGYPQGLKEDEIPFAARVFAVIDIWDALRSDRPYRPAWPEDKIADYIQSLSGNHLDPSVVDAFFALRTNHSQKVESIL
jgi:PAS domain S-box-containing protein